MIMGFYHPEGTVVVNSDKVIKGITFRVHDEACKEPQSEDCDLFCEEWMKLVLTEGHESEFPYTDFNMGVLHKDDVI